MKKYDGNDLIVVERLRAGVRLRHFRTLDGEFETRRHETRPQWFSTRTDEVVHTDEFFLEDREWAQTAADVLNRALGL